jgi:hypothetical protein
MAIKILIIKSAIIEIARLTITIRITSLVLTSLYVEFSHLLLYNLTTGYWHTQVQKERTTKMNIVKQFIDRHGVTFKIERNGKIVSCAPGLTNHESATSRAYIGMLKDADVTSGDWLINPENERFYVEDKVSDFAFGEFQQYKLFYLTESEYKQKNTASATNIFNIGTATGSVIGTQANVTLNYNESIQNAKEQIAASESPDKEDLQKLISLLEMLVNDQVTPQKGLFSKFSAVMERNSWITGSISAALLSWLTSQIH